MPDPGDWNLVFGGVVAAFIFENGRRAAQSQSN
jgi:hypothetical protein